jgi:predicted MFS family arabinose efflux permease
MRKLEWMLLGLSVGLVIGSWIGGRESRRRAKVQKLREAILSAREYREPLRDISTGAG